MVRNSSQKIETLLLSIVFILSTIAIAGWLLNIPILVRFIPGSATIKFNTALLIFLTALTVLINEKTTATAKFLTYFLNGFVAIVATTSLVEYFTPLNLKIDNFFLEDSISENISGRMSPATSVSFILISFGIFCNSVGIKSIKKLCTAIYFIVFTISLASLISFLLFIPILNKTSFFQTMSLPSTILFLSLSTLLMFKYPNIAFNSIMNTKRVGSQLFWKQFPLLIIAPTTISYILLYFSSAAEVNIDFGIALSTNIFIILSCIHLIFLSVKLNKSERERIILEQKITILKENEIRKSLLTETHHRVKNNFQIINSVLGLQSNKSKNMELKMVLSDCQSRIRAISALHESIYINGNFEEVKLRQFLESIIYNLIKIHFDHKHIKVDLKIPNIDLKMEYAMPLGLIINEIVTNSLKHAFTTQTEKLIFVWLTKNDTNEFELCIGDNGVGSSKMSNELHHPSSMGSELIVVFTGQLEGQISVENNNGLKYNLSFKTSNAHLKIA